MKKEYAGSVYFNRFILGEWCAAEGLVYDMFSEDKHVVSNVRTGGEIYVSCDFGVQNATVFLVWQRDDDGRWICIDEWYYSGRENRHQKSCNEMVEGLQDMLNGRIPERIIVDPSAAALIVELRKAGYLTRKANNDVKNGIAETGSALQRGIIAIDARCKNTIREIQAYSWDDKASSIGEDKPIKENDHCMDAMRYFVKTMRLVKRHGEDE